ncbi:aldehyde dehydrogenase (NADP(+)) [Microbacterium imperiale]|uniref:Aldehyde dehydrogenase n=1 Tax=Microbacterium imperiale TaxID=33884 RepID=A0A9W6HK64_9MICO|nr:aldehyde dehydrogenase (NADP(+)) [Microbacterium imperiale]MBP2420867.1 NADP-dependent aldehyde dehydrogenase [Microbacterium imperiale]MDS0200018.1 aldehyde dehydrogenase (NADP(+)) [Microbacterium imperiale]BFE41209.1 aldehyde dehydrogenase (NADP(+)) [Microbacterium imperiale]GLJ81263.1 aldehyde dehydrogenase [Microbacterium imperiale]
MNAPAPIADTPIAEVDAFVGLAAAASVAWRASSIVERGEALRAVADGLDARADDLVELAQRETHLAEGRLRGELRRTTFQLRLFTEVLAEGSWLDARIDHPDADYPMGAPRPDIRRQLEGIGPVLVFAASNFPFAFSVAGGDTASALAAGNAVVLKAHPGHPQLSALTGEIVIAALSAAGAPAGLFTVIHGTDAGVHALRAPQIRAAAFTGSIAGGRALFDIAMSRPEPIPFYGELGSVNPAFVTRSAAASRGAEIAEQFVASVTGSAGQLCTKPGVLFVPRGSGLVDALAAAALPEPAPLLNEDIASGFRRAFERTADHEGVAVLAASPASDGPVPAPALLRADVAAVIADPETLVSEMFGPAALVVEYDEESQLVTAAELLDGQLTATLVADDSDEVARDLLPVLATKAGRVLWNQWPTGVSVTWAQQHGGPYPATTAVGTTSVGTAAMTRFLRPVAYQNVPDALLPEALRDANPLGIPRRVDGVLTV